MIELTITATTPSELTAAIEHLARYGADLRSEAHRDTRTRHLSVVSSAGREQGAS